MSIKKFIPALILLIGLWIGGCALVGYGIDMATEATSGWETGLGIGASTVGSTALGLIVCAILSGLKKSNK